MRIITLVTLSSLALTTACQQGAGYDQNQTTYQGTAIGTAIGAALGGIAGALSNKDNRGKNAAIGAGIGALLGGGVGQYMDRQEQELRQATEGTGIEVVRQGDNLLLNMPSSITFNVGSSNIESAFYPPLNNVANVLREYPNTMLEVTGHTDSTGDESFNYTLSNQRAQSVSNYLAGRGVTQKVVTTGKGESSPIASNATAEGKAQNRRVEIKITPISS